MKRVFVPTQTGTDWQRLLAKPKTHWQPKASAMTCAASWESAADSLPPEISTLLDSSRDRLLMHQRLLRPRRPPLRRLPLRLPAISQPLNKTLAPLTKQGRFI